MFTWGGGAVLPWSSLVIYFVRFGCGRAGGRRDTPPGSLPGLAATPRMMDVPPDGDGCAARQDHDEQVGHQQSGRHGLNLPAGRWRDRRGGSRLAPGTGVRPACGNALRQGRAIGPRRGGLPRCRASSLTRLSQRESCELGFHSGVARLAGDRQVEWSAAQFGMIVIEEGNRAFPAEQEESQAADLALTPGLACGEAR